MRYTRARSSSPPELPIDTKSLSPASSSSQRGAVSFFGTAVITGVILHLLFVGLGGSKVVSSVPVFKDWLPSQSTTYESCTKNASDAAASDLVSGVPQPTPAPANVTDPSAAAEEAELEQLRAMVARTQGYFGRDFSLSLGWNNMRYILEAGLLQATLLNRTLIVPSYVYARACEWEMHSCAGFAEMVNRGDAVGSDEWRHLPLVKQTAWRVPMEVMIDLPRLRKTHNVLLVREYMKLNGLDTKNEWTNGHFDRTGYLGVEHKKTIHVIPNDSYEPVPLVLVDHREPLQHQNISGVESGPVHDKLFSSLSGDDDLVAEWKDAKKAVAEHMRDPESDEEFETILKQHGWATLYTFAAVLGMEWHKSVVDPIRQVTPLSRTMGWIERYKHMTMDILVLDGETHLGRKPGNLRFTTPEARDDFARAVLYSLHPTPTVWRLAEKIAKRISDKVEGRMWMAGHMRRGDFVREGWVMEKTIEDHLSRIKNRLDTGRDILTKIVETQDVQPFDVPDVKPDLTQLTLQPPAPGDSFFLATDERSPEGLEYLRTHGALLTLDLMTIEDRREFGWPIMLTDVIALVEQVVMSKGYYFYAHAMSSVAGGAVNLRGARGADKRTTLAD
ncbi:hypothetical protein FRB99_003665 [Tulasnella sp. 403]|nr:hypothetical protein FRB99_003665 [Tulasnella sp. 403]